MGRLIAFAAISCVVSCVIVLVAFVQTTDVSDVPFLRAIKGVIESLWRRRTECKPAMTPDEVFRATCCQRMSPGYLRNKRDKIRQALMLQMPPLTWLDQCWLYEQAFHESIETRKRCAGCNDEGCEICQPREGIRE